MVQEAVLTSVAAEQAAQVTVSLSLRLSFIFCLYVYLFVAFCCGFGLIGLVSCLAGWLAGWLAGSWLAGWLAVPIQIRLHLRTKDHMIKKELSGTSPSSDYSTMQKRLHLGTKTIKS